MTDDLTAFAVYDNLADIVIIFHTMLKVSKEVHTMITNEYSMHQWVNN
jgi:hypothetical protein